MHVQLILCGYVCAMTWCLLAPLPQVSNFRVIEEGLFSLRLGWTPPLGKLDGYKIFIPRCMLTMQLSYILIYFQISIKLFLKLLNAISSISSCNIGVFFSAIDFSELMFVPQPTDQDSLMSGFFLETPRLMWLTAWKKIRSMLSVFTQFTLKDQVNRFR